MGSVSHFGIGAQLIQGVRAKRPSKPLKLLVVVMPNLFPVMDLHRHLVQLPCLDANRTGEWPIRQQVRRLLRVTLWALVLELPAWLSPPSQLPLGRLSLLDLGVTCRMPSPFASAVLRGLLLVWSPMCRNCVLSDVLAVGARTSRDAPAD
eukprot:1329944-Amphidinium_carterae.1